MNHFLNLAGTAHRPKTQRCWDETPRWIRPLAVFLYKDFSRKRMSGSVLADASRSAWRLNGSTGKLRSPAINESENAIPGLGRVGREQNRLEMPRVKGHREFRGFGRELKWAASILEMLLSFERELIGCCGKACACGAATAIRQNGSEPVNRVRISGGPFQPFLRSLRLPALRHAKPTGSFRSRLQIP